MKKIYILALAASTAVSVHAELPPGNPTSQPLEYCVANDIASMPSMDADGASDPHLTSIKDFNGAFEWSYYGFLQGNSGTRQGRLSMQVIDEATGAVLILGWPQGFAVKAFVDLEAATLTIPNKQPLGRDMNGNPAYFYLKEMTENEGSRPGASDAEATVGAINGDVITFPRLDLWAIGNYQDESTGFVSLTAINILTFLPDVDINGNWEDYGEAVFIDGWVPLRKNLVPAEHSWVVKVQKNADEEGLYRLDSPYLEPDCPDPGTDAGYIVFSIADPEFVVVYPNVYSGFRNVTSSKNDPLYLFNLEGFYNIGQGLSKEAIINAFQDGVEHFSTYADGVVDIHNCCFDITTPARQRYTWSNKTEGNLRFKMVSKITIDKLAGVGDNTIVNEDLPPEYYNLQGIRLDNPQPGQVVIRRHGDKAQKVIVGY